MSIVTGDGKNITSIGGVKTPAGNQAPTSTPSVTGDGKNITSIGGVKTPAGKSSSSRSSGGGGRSRSSGGGGRSRSRSSTQQTTQQQTETPSQTSQAPTTPTQPAPKPVYPSAFATRNMRTNQSVQPPQTQPKKPRIQPFQTYRDKAIKKIVEQREQQQKSKSYLMSDSVSRAPTYIEKSGYKYDSPKSTFGGGIQYFIGEKVISPLMTKSEQLQFQADKESRTATGGTGKRFIAAGYSAVGAAATIITFPGQYIKRTVGSVFQIARDPIGSGAEIGRQLTYRPASFVGETVGTMAVSYGVLKGTSYAYHKIVTKPTVSVTGTETVRLTSADKIVDVSKVQANVKVGKTTYKVGGGVVEVKTPDVPIGKVESVYKVVSGKKVVATQKATARSVVQQTTPQTSTSVYFGKGTTKITGKLKPVKTKTVDIIYSQTIDKTTTVSKGFGAVSKKKTVLSMKPKTEYVGQTVRTSEIGFGTTTKETFSSITLGKDAPKFVTPTTPKIQGLSLKRFYQSSPSGTVTIQQAPTTTIIAQQGVSRLATQLAPPFQTPSFVAPVTTTTSVVSVAKPSTRTFTLPSKQSTTQQSVMVTRLDQGRLTRQSTKPILTMVPLSDTLQESMQETGLVTSTITSSVSRQGRGRGRIQTPIQGTIQIQPPITTTETLLTPTITTTPTTPPPPPPKIPILPNLKLQSNKPIFPGIKTSKVPSFAPKYRPTVYSIFTGRTATSISRAGVRTGLGVRPIISKSTITPRIKKDDKIFKRKSKGRWRL